MPAPESTYRLDDLGWLQFERLCTLVLEADGGLRDVGWLGRADRGRMAHVDRPISLPDVPRLAGPVTVIVAWSPGREAASARVDNLVARITGRAAELGSWCEDDVLVLTNLDAVSAGAALRADPFIAGRTVRVVGADELGAALDRHAGLRLAMPSVLGLRDLAPLIGETTRARSSLDVDRARALAAVFWPTQAYNRARRVLARHRFVVLTGPPEMGKTAIAQMLALAQLTDGWEAHECSTPDQLWQVYEPGQRQVFIADDAFGSTEYRPDSAERWASALGRLLAILDDRHWLIWTSRPAPLKAGLRRVQRERGSERFPAPGEVLVDAGELDLGERTLILFRHAKARLVSRSARELVRSLALSIVEHPHFTPERIRRFVADRIEGVLELPAQAPLHMVVERELRSPSEAMRVSFRALEREHRELLIALLDAPAGLIDERELAATIRRHHAGGLSRAPHELIDRLTDHFLRVTPLGIDWVHPSWRDLVIEELREDASSRERFLRACDLDGATLALSHEGGSMGTRRLPLLEADADWDLLGECLARLTRELEPAELTRLLVALRDACFRARDGRESGETSNLAASVARSCARRFDAQGRPLPVYLLEAWYTLSEWAPEPVEPPRLGCTWVELHPGSLNDGVLDGAALARADEWLALAQILARYDPDALDALGFHAHDHRAVALLTAAIGMIDDPERWQLAEGTLQRIADLGIGHVALVGPARARARRAGATGRWYIPEDIAAPPSTEPVSAGSVEFRHSDVSRVFNDL